MSLRPGPRTHSFSLWPRRVQSHAANRTGQLAEDAALLTTTIGTLLKKLLHCECCAGATGIDFTTATWTGVKCIAEATTRQTAFQTTGTAGMERFGDGLVVVVVVVVVVGGIS